MSTSPPNLKELLTAVGIPECILDKKCSNEHILKIADFLIGCRAFVPRMGITDVEQDEIEIDGHCELERKWKVLKLWSRKNGINATYRWLVNAFLRVGDADSTEKVPCPMQVNSS